MSEISPKATWVGEFLSGHGVEAGGETVEEPIHRDGIAD